MAGTDSSAASAARTPPAAMAWVTKPAARSAPLRRQSQNLARYSRLLRPRAARIQGRAFIPVAATAARMRSWAPAASSSSPRTVILAFRRSKARRSWPPMTGPTAALSAATSSAQSRPSTWKEWLPG